MNKEQILAKLEELEREAAEIRAELAAIKETQSLVASVDSSRADEMAHALARRVHAVDHRIARWNRECDLIEAEVSKLAA